MLGLAEYKSASAQLYQLGESYEVKIADTLTPDITKANAIAETRALAMEYQKDYQKLLYSSLIDAAENAVSYYQGKLGVDDLDQKEVAKEIVDRQYSEKYYGATLNQRLKVNERALTRRIVHSAQISKASLTKVFTSTVPFGAQTNVDKRVLLGTMVKIEQDTAKEMAARAKLRLIRWTLSSHHKVACTCEDYASRINSSAVRLMQDAGITEDPKGLYLVEELPSPPHPNCQCEYAMVVDNKTQGRARVRRSIEKVKRLLRNIRKR